jgi:hypothetical protein
MRGNQVTAIHRAIDGHLALGAAAHRADFFTLRGTKSFGFSLIANGANHIRRRLRKSFLNNGMMQSK